MTFARVAPALFSIALAASFAHSHARAQDAPATEAPATTQAPATTRVAATQRVELPSFGMTIPIPKGFVRGPESEYSVCMLVPAEQLWERTNRAIMIKLTPRHGKTFSQVVRDTAARSQMRVVRQDAKWGNREAAELVAEDIPGAADGAPRVRRTLMLEREAFIFAVSYAAVARHADDLRAFNEVVEKTRWLPFSRAGAGLAPHPGHRLVVEGLQMNIPDPFRPDPTRRRGQPPIFEARDLPTRVMVARLVVLPLSPERRDRIMQDVKAEVDQRLTPHWKLRAPLVWQDEPGPVSFALSDKQLTEEGWMQVMIALPPDGAAVVISLHCRATQAAVEGLERTLLLVRASIEPAQ